MRHYGMEGRKIQTGQGNENGDIEQRHASAWVLPQQLGMARPWRSLFHQRSMTGK
jgi:hypothetical protein